MATQLAHNEQAQIRSKAFDWWFSRFHVLYDILLFTHLGPRLVKALPHIRGPRVLEVSFGLGYLMTRYAAGFDVTGIDYNPSYVEATRQRLHKAGLHDVKLLEADAHALPFDDDSFDTLLNTDAFTLYDTPTQAISEFFRVIEPGGRLVLMEYDYPADGNKLGTLCTNHMRRTAQYIDFRKLLRDAGFAPIEDHDVGLFGMCRMFIATKPSADY